MNAAKITLTATVVAAALGLALGLAAAPAQADCGAGTKHTGTHPHCNKEDTGGDDALLTLSGDMVTDVPIDVTVKQNSAKRLQFGNSNFGLPGIQLDFDVMPRDCVVERPGLENVGPTVAQLLVELNGANIDAGSLIFRIDKKNLTAIYVIEYFLPDGPLEGRIRVQTLSFGRDGIPAEVDDVLFVFPNIGFTISGVMGIWWSNLSGLNEDIIVACGPPPGSPRMVDVVLTS